MKDLSQDTICAPATAQGQAGLAVVRVSGGRAAQAVAALAGAGVAKMTSHTLKLAVFRDEEGIIDEGVVSYFTAPRSYTGEEVMELSVHASSYIVERLLRALVKQGVRMATAGEFTQRAFLNGKMDLSQAEAVADLIAGESKAAHDMAIAQLRGGFSSEIEALRQKLLDFVALVELELDFSEEDVEFADRSRLRELLAEIDAKVEALRASFQAGNALKEGIPVVIVGKPNAGKSTLINALLHEERALVSDIPGTTRDTVEEVWNLGGAKFRLIDTAGLRQSDDKVERMGVERTLQKMQAARVWLYVFDRASMPLSEARKEVDAWRERVSVGLEKSRQPVVFWVANKADETGCEPHRENDIIYLSAKTGAGLEFLQEALKSTIPALPDGQTAVLNNLRHYEALGLVKEDLARIAEGMEGGLPGDLLSIDIHAAIDHLGLITGKILSDDVLGAVFSRFCIGK